jgi:hypothetical protein
MKGWDKLPRKRACDPIKQAAKEATMCWLYGEPTLEDMLADPTINALMERDEVDPDALALFLEDIKTALQPLPVQ